MIDTRNLILAVVLSVGILTIYNAFLAPTPETPPPGQQTAVQGEVQPTVEAPADTTATPRPDAPTATPSVPQANAPEAPPLTRNEVLARTDRVPLNSSTLEGSIALTGGRIDDLVLSGYRETPDPESPNIVLLKPRGVPDAYFAEFGWVASDNIPTPGADTRWTADGNELTPDKPLTLSWDNGQGLRFLRTVTLDDGYMFSVRDRVENTGDTPVKIHPYGLVERSQTPEVSGFYILHEGLLGVFNGTLEEIDYEELREEKGADTRQATGGWIGITDKYWLSSLVPDQSHNVTYRFSHRQVSGDDRYQVDYLGDGVTLAPGGETTFKTHLFAGAKEVKLLDAYTEELGVRNFDLAIDFGWFYFLTKPIFYALLYIHQHVGNFGIAILLLTVAIKLLFFPLANKSYRSMSKMRKLQPEMTRLREQFGDDKARLNQEVMALYKREKANPASGCLPILIQIPVFFALYKVLYVTIEMRHAPFFGWIQDLSAPDPTSLFNLFGLIPWTPPDFLAIGVWPLAMGITMFLQQKLNPQPADPVQAKIFMFLPLMFTVMLARFPAGLVIYWTWNNILSVLQQWTIMRRAGVR